MLLFWKLKRKTDPIKVRCDFWQWEREKGTCMKGGAKVLFG